VFFSPDNSISALPNYAIPLSMDLYCERTSLSLFDEPVNILTNLAFLVAGYYVFREFIKTNTKKKYLIFPILIIFIGLGSFAFHTLPNRLTLLSDVIPIFLFSIALIFFIQKDIIQTNLYQSVAWVILFLTLSFLVAPNIDLNLNGSEGYLPNYFFLLGYVIYFYFKKDASFKNMMMAFIIFNISLFFRSVDNLICAQFNLGTHFLWHIFNAILLSYLALIFKNNEKS